MKSILLAALLSLSSSFAFAQSEAWEVVYMHLGRAIYNGTATGDMKMTNQGPNDLTNIKWSISGHGFSAKDNCPKVLTVGKSCRIRVTYWNTFPGYASGLLKVTTSDKKYSVQLSAEGADDPFRNMPRPPTYPPHRP